MIQKAFAVQQALWVKHRHAQWTLQGMVLRPDQQRDAIQTLNQNFPAAKRNGDAYLYFWQIYERLVQESRFCKRMAEIYGSLLDALRQFPENAPCNTVIMSAVLTPYFNLIQVQTEDDREFYALQNPSGVPQRTWYLVQHQEEKDYSWSPYHSEPWNSEWEKPKSLLDFLLKRAYIAGSHTPLNFHHFQRTSRTQLDHSSDLGPTQMNTN